jgi:hypothetical protein
MSPGHLTHPTPTPTPTTTTNRTRRLSLVQVSARETCPARPARPACQATRSRLASRVRGKPGASAGVTVGRWWDGPGPQDEDGGRSRGGTALLGEGVGR